MNKEEERWLEEIAFEINSLSADAFDKKDSNAFRKKKNKILIHFVGATATIEEFLESEDTNG